MKDYPLKQKKMDQQFANKIVWLNLLFTFQIVFRHTSVVWGQPEGISLHLLTWNRQATYISLAFFFFTSGFLFFYNFTIKDYVPKLKKRVRTLLLPLVIWNCIAYVCLNIYRMVWGDDVIRGLKNFLLGFTLANQDGLILFDGPLWYMLRLFSYVLLTPVFYYLLRRKVLGFCSVLVIFGMDLLVFHGDWFSFSKWLFIYSLGAYLALNYGSAVFESSSYDSSCIARIMGIGAALIALSSVAIGLSEIDVGKYGEWFTAFYGSLIVLCVFALLRPISLPVLPAWIRGFAFFVYALHYIILLYVKQLLLPLVRAVNGGNVAWILHGCVVILICFAAFQCVRRAPKVSSLLAGGRS